MNTDTFLYYDLFLDAKRYLGITTRTRVVIEENRPKRLAAICQGDWNHKGVLVRCDIKINHEILTSSKYNIDHVILHELIHAKMLEDNTFDAENHHCKVFQAWAAKLETYYGYRRETIYNSKIDD